MYPASTSRTPRPVARAASPETRVRANATSLGPRAFQSRLLRGRRRAAIALIFLCPAATWPQDAAAQDAPTDAISREFTVFNDLAEDVQFTDAVSRELTVYSDLDGPITPTDAISRELTVYNDLDNPVQITDAVSRELTTFTCIPLQLGTAYSGNLVVGGQLYFRLTVPANLTVRITLDHTSPTAWTELYASFNALPTDATAEFVFASPSHPDQEVIIPNTQAGTYYILARATNETASGQSGAFTLLAADLPFGVQEVQPPIVGAGEEVTLRVVGGHLDMASSIHLRPSGGGLDLLPARTMIADAAHARLRFNLLGATLGTYDIISQAANGGPTVTLATVVTLQPPSQVRQDLVTVSVVGTPGIRHGGTGPGTVTLVNTSNVDAPITHLTFVSPYDPEITITIGSDPGMPLAGTTDYRWAESWYENIGPGESIVIPFAIKLGHDPAVDPIPLYVQHAVFTRAQFRMGFLLRSGGMLDEELQLMRQQPEWTPEFETTFVPEYRRLRTEAFDAEGLSGLGLPSVDPRLLDNGPGARSVHIYCGDKCDTVGAAAGVGCLYFGPTPMGAICLAGVAGATIACKLCCNNPCQCRRDLCPNNDLCDPPCDIGGKCPQVCELVSASQCFEACDWNDGICLDDCNYFVCKTGQCFDGPLVWDPNEKNSPPGYADERFLTGEGVVAYAYEVSFENLPAAQAPAAIVKITDALDPALDTSTFRLGRIYFGSSTINVPLGRSSFHAVLDLLSTHGVLVDVAAGIDVADRVAWWQLTALDPQTMQVPANAYVGFLPPEDGTGRGQGGVSFTIAPWADGSTGDVVRNKASIIFDYNDPIETNEVFNTIDAGSPSTVVLAPPSQALTPLHLEWAGTDDAGGCGIAGFDVYASTNGVDYGLWYAGPASAGIFRGDVGKTYAFFSLATDNVGNAEEAPLTPDATTTIVGCGDANLDGQHSLADCVSLVACATGPVVPLSGACATVDLDRDGDVDFRDFGEFQVAFGQPGGAADFDRDGDVDLADYAAFAGCETRPTVPLSPLCAGADLDGDGDVDLADFAAFQGCYVAP